MMKTEKRTGIRVAVQDDNIFRTFFFCCKIKHMMQSLKIETNYLFSSYIFFCFVLLDWRLFFSFPQTSKIGHALDSMASILNC